MFIRYSELLELILLFAYGSAVLVLVLELELILVLAEDRFPCLRNCMVNKWH